MKFNQFDIPNSSFDIPPVALHGLVGIHDRPGDVLKTNINEDGIGGDEAPMPCLHLVATKVPWRGTAK